MRQTIRQRHVVPPGVEERFAPVAGHRMRYLVAGSGPPLLLVHGLMGYSFSFTEIIPQLSQSHQVFAPDALNIGLSDRAEVDASFEAIAHRMLDFMDAVQVESATVMATSHGGAIAMLMAILAPERIRHLVLVSPAHPWSERSRWQIRLFASVLGAPLAWLMSLVPQIWMAIGLRRLYFDPSRMRPGTLAGYSKPVQDSRTLAFLLRVARYWERDFAGIEARLPELGRTQIDLIWGENDVVVPFSTAAALQRALPHAQLQMIPECGHLPYEERPAEFMACLNKALANG